MSECSLLILGILVLAGVLIRAGYLDHINPPVPTEKRHVLPSR
jgi:hypothetical protein